MRPIPCTDGVSRSQLVYFRKGHCIIEYLNKYDEIYDLQSNIKIQIVLKTVNGHPLSPHKTSYHIINDTNIRIPLKPTIQNKYSIIEIHGDSPNMLDMSSTENKELQQSE
ncbi:MAG: hypothetical protein ABIH86_05870 [Planctomycetota bacterium]